MNETSHYLKKTFKNEEPITDDDYVSACGNLEIEPFEYIFRREDANFIASNGETPLTSAIKAGNRGAIMMLFEQLDVDLKMVNGRGEEPADLVMDSGNDEMINLFSGYI